MWKGITPLLAALRPQHWVKNVVVFAAPLFAVEFTVMALASSTGAFIAFSATASSFYLFNDVQDIDKDRNHPTKKQRPIASGRVSIRLALGMAAVLLVSGLVGSYFVAPWLAVTIASYAVIQFGYNFGLKNEPILDIMVVAGGFVLRALGGAAATGVAASGWFILCVGLLAFFLGIEKRKAEIKSLGDDQDTRAVLHQYSLSWLRRMEAVVTSSALMAYALWTLEGADTPWMLSTLPFVAYAIFRYQYLSEQGGGEKPERILVRDRGMIVSILLWGVISLLILRYGKLIM